MKFTRRTLLKSALVAGTAAIGTQRVPASSSAPLGLRVFDSGLPSSRAWLSLRTGPAIDVDYQRRSRWAYLRSFEPGGVVSGLTSWSDFVQVRGLLQEKGKRLRLESRRGDLFYWEMA
jgi:hypothetical protein